MGWVGFILVSLLPVFVELSSEIRQYPLLLCFMMAAAYMLELALDENSAGKMAIFFFFLYLAMLTHFSAILFAGAVGAYSLWRLVSDRPSRRVVAIWIAGQAGALGLFVFLYVTQISKLKAGASAQHMQVLLANSYFHRGHDHLLGFIFARTSEFSNTPLDNSRSATSRDFSLSPASFLAADREEVTIDRNSREALCPAQFGCCC